MNKHQERIDMKRFVFSDNGICVNPNEIFRSASDNAYAEPYRCQTPQSFTIETAQTHTGKWVSGYHVNGRSGCQSSPCSAFGASYDSEKAATLAAIINVNAWFRYADRSNNDRFPAYDGKLKKLLEECRDECIQLSLF